MNRTVNIHQFITEHNSNINYIKKALLLKQCNLNYWNNGTIKYTKVKSYVGNVSELINDIISNGYIATTNGDSIIYIKNNTVREITYDVLNSAEIDTIKITISDEGYIPFAIDYIPVGNKYIICITFLYNNYLVFRYYDEYEFVYAASYPYSDGLNTNICAPLIKSYIYTHPYLSFMLGVNLIEQPTSSTTYNISLSNLYDFYLNMPYIADANYLQSILFINSPNGHIENIRIEEDFIYREIITLQSELAYGSQSQIKDKNVITYLLHIPYNKDINRQYVVNTQGRYMYYYFNNILWNEVKIDKITKQMWVTVIHNGTAVYKNNCITIYNERYQYYNCYGKIFKIYSNDDITHTPVALSISSIPTVSVNTEQKHLRINNNILRITRMSPNIITDGEIISQKEKYENI